MAFATRCPECQAKLTLADRPPGGTPVECPKCGSLFVPPRPATVREVEDDADDARPPRKPARRPAADAPDRAGKPAVKTAPKPKPKVGRVVRSKKKKTNPFVLLAMVAGSFVVLAGLYAGMQYMLGRAGRVTELLAFVPADANWVRGVNTAQLSRYPGYKSEVDKHVTPAVREAADALAVAAGQDPAVFLDYFMAAKTRTGAGPSGTLYLMRSKKPMKPAAVAAAINGATPTQVGAEPGAKCGSTAPGILANSTVFFPSDAVAVIVPDGPGAGALAAQSAAGKGAGGKSNFLQYYETEDTVRVCSRGSVWLVVRTTGALKSFVEAGTKPVEQDFKELHTAAAATTTFGVWTTPGGGGVILGAAFEAADKAAARNVVRSMWNGPLGKADESEPTNTMKQAGISFVQDKRVFSEFMQNMDYVSDGKCVFMRSKIGAPDSVKRMLDAFNNAGMANDAAPAAGGFGGRGGPG